MDRPLLTLSLPPGKLVCLACGQAADCAPADAVRYIRARDWPRCCGAVMAFCPTPSDRHQPRPAQ